MDEGPTLMTLFDFLSLKALFPKPITPGGYVILFYLFIFFGGRNTIQFLMYNPPKAFNLMNLNGIIIPF